MSQLLSDMSWGPGSCKRNLHGDAEMHRESPRRMGTQSQEGGGPHSLAGPPPQTEDQVRQDFSRVWGSIRRLAVGAAGPGLALSHRQASPVNDVEGVQVADGAGHLGGVKPGPGLQEPALPLQVEEELEGEETCERVPGGLQLLESGVGGSWPSDPLSKLQCPHTRKGMPVPAPQSGQSVSRKDELAGVDHLLSFRLQPDPLTSLISFIIFLTTFQVSSRRPVSQKRKLEESEQSGDLPKVTYCNWQSCDVNPGASKMCISSNPGDKMIMIVKLSLG